MRSLLTPVVLVAGGCNAVFGLDPVAVDDRPPPAVVQIELPQAPAALVAGALRPGGPVDLVVTTGSNLVVVVHNGTTAIGQPRFVAEPLTLAAARHFGAAALVAPSPGAAPVLATIDAGGTLFRIASDGTSLTATDRGLALVATGDVLLGGGIAAGEGAVLIGTPGTKTVRAVGVESANELTGATVAKNLIAWIPAELDGAPPGDAVLALESGVVATIGQAVDVGGPFARDLDSLDTLGLPLAAGDLDGDGRDDVVATRGTTLEAYLNRGTALTIGVGHTFDVGAPSLLAIGDVDGDGRGDLITVTPGDDGSTRLVLAPGDGLGGFSPTPPLPLAGQARGLIVADLDDDGRADVAVAVAIAGSSGDTGAIHVVLPR